MAEENLQQAKDRFREMYKDLLEKPDPIHIVPQNPAVSRCVEGWARSQAQSIAEGKSHETAKIMSDHIYRLSIPPLVGAQNISDFIACVTYGALLGAVAPDEITRLLYAAQVAIGAQKAAPNFR